MVCRQCGQGLTSLLLHGCDLSGSAYLLAAAILVCLISIGILQMIPEYVPEDNRQARVGNHEPPSIPDRSRFTGQFAGASATEIDSASFRHLGARHPFEKQIYCAGLRLLPDCGSTVLHPPRWAVGESRQARSSLAQRI